MEFRKHFVIAVSRKFKALPIFGFLSLLIFGFMFFSDSVFDPFIGNGSKPSPQSIPVSQEPDAVTKAKVRASLMRLPLSFEANEGQTDPQVKFLSRSGNHSVFFTPDKIVMSLAGHSLEQAEKPGKVKKTAFTPSPVIPAPSGAPTASGGGISPAPVAPSGASPPPGRGGRRGLLAVGAMPTNLKPLPLSGGRTGWGLKRRNWIPACAGMTAILALRPAVPATASGWNCVR
jgi:hypothetical protein